MSIRGAKFIFTQTLAVMASVKSCHLYPLRSYTIYHCFKAFDLNPFIGKRGFSGSSQDDLEGLIDPDFSFPGNEASLAQDKTSELPVCSSDFSFLNDTLLDSSPSAKSSEMGVFSDEARLISDAINNNNDGFGDKTQKLLRQFREKMDDSLVIEVLKLVKNPELGVKFFIWGGRQIGYSHTAAAYNALLERLGCSNNGRIPEHCLRAIREDDREILRRLLNVLIRKYCRNGYWNGALEELGRLKDFGYKPSKATYNALIQVLVEADRLDTAYLVHKEMMDSGFNMDRFTLSCFAYSLCKEGRWKEALRMIEREEFVPDTVIYTKMISGLCDASLFDEAMDFLHRMRSSSCMPNVVTYRMLLSKCLKKRQLGRCKRLLSMMMSEGCYPNPLLFNSLVYAYCSSRDYAYAYKLLNKMVECGCKPGYVVYNALIGGICGNEELPRPDALELAEKAYREMLDAGFVLNKVNVSHFARSLCGAGKFEKAFTIIREMMSKGFVPDTSNYSQVIGFLCEAFKVEKAFFLFEEMKRNGIVPDLVTYTILIDRFCKAGLIEQAQNWFNEMGRDGCTPNVVTYTALIHAYLKARRVSSANELFEKMLSAGCVPNVVTYTALIDGHCKVGETDKACQIYMKMKESVEIPDIDMYFKGDHGKSIEPNVFTYGALIDGLCKAHKVDEARDILDAMSVAGCEPNQVVYDALIDGFCKAGKLDEAQDVFARMSECGYSPNVYTYSSLIDRLFKDKRLDLALKVLYKMLDNDCPPNVVTYTEMVDGLCKVGKTDEAYKLLGMMEEKGCCPNVVTYTAIIDGFGKVGKINTCLELLKQMSAKGCAPNFVTYRVLVNHCCAAGLLDEAHKLLEEMKQTYWPRHITGYRKVIEGFSQEFLTSLGLVDEIAEDNVWPIVPFYKILIDSFCRAGRVEVALELHREILEALKFSAATKNIYSSLIESLSLACRVEKAFELYGDMIRRGYIPEIGVLFQLIMGLIKVNRWAEALQLADSVCCMDINWYHGEQVYDNE